MSGQVLDRRTRTFARVAMPAPSTPLTTNLLTREPAESRSGQPFESDSRSLEAEQGSHDPTTQEPAAPVVDPALGHSLSRFIVQRRQAKPSAGSPMDSPALPALALSPPAPVHRFHQVSAYQPRARLSDSVPGDSHGQEADQAADSAPSTDATPEEKPVVETAPESSIARQLMRQPGDAPPPVTPPSLPAGPGAPAAPGGGDPNNPAVPMGGGAGTSATNLSVVNTSRAISGATLTAVWNAMTNSGAREAASVTPKLTPDPKYDYDANDNVKSVVVTVVETKEMPKWTEADKQCPPIKAEWDRFLGVIGGHEDHHLSIDKKHFGSVHLKLVGKKREKAWKALDDEVDAADKENDAYDTSTQHGVTEGANINTAVQCAPEKIKSTSSDPNMGGDSVPEAAGSPAALPPSAQARLTVNRVGDAYEQEAERTADRVMRMESPNVSNVAETGASGLQRACAGPGNCECAACRAAHAQRKATSERNLASDVTETVSTGLSGTGRPLDAGTRAFMEPRFGHSFSKVRIYADSRASRSTEQIAARAYTVGSSIAFRSGEYQPGTGEGRRLLAHELTHVIQQGSAAPTEVQPKRGDEPLATPGSLPNGPNVVQRAPVPTMGGEFDTDKYDTVTVAGDDQGVDIDLKFHPTAAVDATTIGMVQTANSILAGTPHPLNDTVKNRSIPAGEPGHTEGAHIDRLSPYGNPLYAAKKPMPGDTLAATPTSAGWGQHGWHFKDPSGVVQSQDAHLKDKPQLPGRGDNASQIFETTALAVAGVQNGTYYGSVRWGWKTDGSGAFSKLPLSLISAGIPSPTFLRAAELWNTNPTSDGTATIPLPTGTINAAAMSTADIVKKIATLTTEIANVPAGPGTDRTNKELDKQKLQEELGKRNAMIDVSVHRTIGSVFDDKVYVKMTGPGGTSQSAQAKMGDSSGPEAFAVPLAGIVPISGTLHVEVWNHNALGSDDFIIAKDWTPPYPDGAAFTGGVGRASYTVILHF